MIHNIDEQRTSKTSMAFSFNFALSAFFHSMAFSYKPHLFAFFHETQDMTKLNRKITKQRTLKEKRKTVSSGSSENSVPCTLKFSPCFKQWLSPLFKKEESLHTWSQNRTNFLPPSTNTEPVRPHRERRDNHALTNMQLPLVLSWSSPFINPGSPSLACSPRWISGPWCLMMIMTSSASISAFNHHFATLATPCGGWAEPKTSHASRISLLAESSTSLFEHERLKITSPNLTTFGENLSHSSLLF